MAVAFVPILFGLRPLFLWARPEVVATDAILQMKAPYLNPGFFIVRAIAYFAVWLFCVYLLNKWSASQDRGEASVTTEDMVRFRTLSAPGLLALVLTVSLASVDWIMSVDPHWYSTIFGLLTVVGQGLSALAFTIAVLAVIACTGTLGGVLAPGQFHDLGKLLLAFVMLWAYLSFSQFLIIWSANLPEEIPWYIAAHPRRLGRDRAAAGPRPLRPALRAACSRAISSGRAACSPSSRSSSSRCGWSI